jgi:hypothetical protein
MGYCQKDTRHSQCQLVIAGLQKFGAKKQKNKNNLRDSFLHGIHCNFSEGAASIACPKINDDHLSVYCRLATKSEEFE